MEFTKEQAIDLWFKFINSDRVRKHTNGYGPGGYLQFILTLEIKGNKIEQITLITNGIYSHEEFDREINDKTIKELCTPFGNFTLTVVEADKCRDAWKYRDTKKDHLKYDELLSALG